MLQFGFTLMQLSDWTCDTVERWLLEIACCEALEVPPPPMQGPLQLCGMSLHLCLDSFCVVVCPREELESNHHRKRLEINLREGTLSGKASLGLQPSRAACFEHIMASKKTRRPTSTL